MPIYEYRATDADGNDRSGAAEAETREALVGRLKSQDLQVSFVSEKRDEVQTIPSSRRAVGADLMLFNEQLSSMIIRDLPLAPALRALAHDARTKRFRLAIKDAAGRVEQGQNLSSALAEHPNVFSKVYVKMIEAGEMANNLPVVLGALADYSRVIMGIRSSIRAALVYPIVVSTVALGVLTLILMVVVPGLGGLYTDMGIDIPPMTQWLLSLSAALRRYRLYVPVVLLGGFFLSAIGWRFLRSTLVGRYWSDALLLRLPLIGRFVKAILITRFCGTMSLLLKGGAPLVQAVEVMKEASGNAVLEVALDNVEHSVREGHGFSEGLEGVSVFPRSFQWMLSIAEKRGELPDELSRLADVYSEDASSTAQTLNSVFEPMFICLLAIVVGTVVTALFLPLIRIMSWLGG